MRRRRTRKARRRPGSREWARPRRSRYRRAQGATQRQGPGPDSPGPAAPSLPPSPRPGRIGLSMTARRRLTQGSVHGATGKFFLDASRRLELLRVSRGTSGILACGRRRRGAGGLRKSRAPQALGPRRWVGVGPAPSTAVPPARCRRSPRCSPHSVRARSRRGLERDAGCALGPPDALPWRDLSRFGALPFDAPLAPAGSGPEVRPGSETTSRRVRGVLTQPLSFFLCTHGSLFGPFECTCKNFRENLNCLVCTSTILKKKKKGFGREGRTPETPGKEEGPGRTTFRSRWVLLGRHRNQVRL